MSLIEEGYAERSCSIAKARLYGFVRHDRSVTYETERQAFVSASSSSALSLVGISVPPGNAGTRVART